MTHYLNSLETLLEAEVENYRRLKELEEAKTTALVDGDMEQLQKILSEGSSLAKDLKKLDERRIETQAQWAIELKLEPPKSLGELIPLTDEVRQKRFSELRSSLLELSRDIARLNRSNEVLVTESMSHLNRLFDIVTGRGRVLTYSDKGEATDMGQRRLIDRSA